MLRKENVDYKGAVGFFIRQTEVSQSQATRSNVLSWTLASVCP